MAELSSSSSSPSKKHKAFVSEAMGEKDVEQLPGIGNVFGPCLKAKGFGKANNVLGKFLVFDKNESEFKAWLKETCGANADQQKQCYQSLKEWCDAFL